MGRPERARDRAVGLVLGAVALAGPMLVMPFDAYDPFRFPKVLVVRLAALLILAIWSIWIIWNGRWSSGPLSAGREPLVKIALAVAGAVGVSTLASDQPEVSLWTLIDVVAGLTLFFAAWRYGAARRGHYLLWMIVFSGIVNCAILFSQDLGIWSPLADLERLEAEQPVEARILSKAGLIGNRNGLAVFLLIPTSIAMSFSFSSSAPVRRAGSVLTVLLAASLIWSTTLTAMLTMGLLIAIGVFLHLRSAGLSLRSRALIIGALLLLLTTTPLANSDVRNRIASFTAATSAEELMFHAFQGRVLSFGSALQMALEHPLTGIGPGRFAHEYVDAVINLKEGYPALKELRHGELFDMVHNDYLETLAETGAIGFGLSIAFLLRYLFIVYQRALRDHEIRSVAAALSGSGAAVCALFLFPMQLAAVYGVLAVVCGLGLSRCEQE